MKCVRLLLNYFTTINMQRMRGLWKQFLCLKKKKETRQNKKASVASWRDLQRISYYWSSRKR